MWQEIFKQYLYPAIVTAIGTAGVFVIGYIVKFIKAQIARVQNEAVQKFLTSAATTVVLYVEQKYPDIAGSDKFKKAIENLEIKIDDFTEKLGLGREIVGKKDLEQAIEAAVKTLNNDWTTTQNPTLPK